MEIVLRNLCSIIRFELCYEFLALLNKVFIIIMTFIRNCGSNAFPLCFIVNISNGNFLINTLISRVDLSDFTNLVRLSCLNLWKIRIERNRVQIEVGMTQIGSNSLNILETYSKLWSYLANSLTHCEIF